MMQFSGPAERHRTVAVKVGKVTVGGSAPVVVQSMTNTDTADADATARQVAALARAGSEIVRITVDRAEAAAAVPTSLIEQVALIGPPAKIREELTDWRSSLANTLLAHVELDPASLHTAAELLLS